MTKSEFRKLCDEYQKGPYSEGFDAYELIDALNTQGIDFDELNLHDSVKEWFKDCIEEEYNIGPLITEWYKEGFADFYKIDFSMGTMATIIALATADDFYEAFEDYFDDDEEVDYDYAEMQSMADQVDGVKED